MEVNNDAHIYEDCDPVEELNDEAITMEEPLAEDLCDATMLAKSTVERTQIDVEVFGRECVENVPRVGLIFESKEKLIEQLSEWAIKCSVSFKVIKSRSNDYTVRCDIDENCPWRVHAHLSKKKSHNWWKIKSYGGDHTCLNSTVNTNHRQATAKFICSKILPLVKSETDMTAKNVQETMSNMFHVKVTYAKAWQGLTKALGIIYGDWDSSYAELPKYLKEVQNSNPGTVYKVIHTRGVFDGAFWAFGPSIEGFAHCRPLLSIDGTHLYGKYLGTLLVATGVDANQGLYPLAYAIVQTESWNTWKWFISCMWKYIPSLHNRCITFVSDRAKGIPRALVEGWPAAHYHRYCIRHIKANFKKAGFGTDALQNLLHACATASEVVKYEEFRKQLKTVSPEGDAWIERSLRGQEENWTLCKDGGRRFNMMTTNVSKSFNGVLKGTRNLPVRSLVARTFHRVNHYFYERRTQGELWTSRLTPKWEAMAKKKMEESRRLNIERYNYTEWQVKDPDMLDYTVNVEDNEAKCSCNMPTLEHFPCPHVLAACSRGSGGANRAHDDFISPWYTTMNYNAAYSPLFHPVRDSRYWTVYEGPYIKPPPERRNSGRPRSTRLKGAMDQSTSHKQDRCSKCGVLGHKRTSCNR